MDIENQNQLLLLPELLDGCCCNCACRGGCANVVAEVIVDSGEVDVKDAVVVFCCVTVTICVTVALLGLFSMLELGM